MIRIGGSVEFQVVVKKKKNGKSRKEREQQEMEVTGEVENKD